MPTNVYVLEDHPLVQETLCALVNVLPGRTVCGTARTAPEALEQLAKLAADIVLIDISLPGMDGIAFLRELRRHHPDLPCLMVSTHDETRYVQQALAAGAQGYVIKHRFGEVGEAIQHVLNREVYVSPGIRDWS